LLNTPQRLEGVLPRRNPWNGRAVAALRERAVMGSSWWADGIVVVVATLVVGGPLLFTRNGFSWDFTNNLWLVWVQAKAIGQHDVPTYFVNAPPLGVFYPFFEFYGGTLYAVTGGLAAVVGGDAVAAFVGVTLIAIAAAYGGLLWLARQLGVRGWMAHAPAITYVASAYYVTNLYGRSDWGEVIATSAIPLLMASGWRLARGHRFELLPAVLFVLSAVFFAGSHNVTLVLGTVVLIGAVILLRLATGKGTFTLSLRRALAIGALFLLALAVNAWFLLPDVVHASETQVGSQWPIPYSFTSFFNTPGVLFNPLRAVPHQSGTPALYVQAPDWLLGWALGVGTLLWSRSHPQLRRAAVAMVLTLVALLALIMVAPLWNAMPQTFRDVQFPYRLNTYVALCSAGLVLISALVVQRSGGLRRGRALRVALAGACGISIGLCIWQLWVPNPDEATSYRNRDQALKSTHVVPRTWYDQNQYADASAPLIVNTRGALAIPPISIRSDHVHLTVTPPPGAQPFVTNISAGPYAARLTGGLVRVGRTATGFTVARRRNGASGPVSAGLEPAGGTVTIGQAISLLAIAVLLVGLAIWISEPLDCWLRGARGPRARSLPNEVGD
jgi:hypothetical protein